MKDKKKGLCQERKINKQKESKIGKEKEKKSKGGGVKKNKNENKENNNNIIFRLFFVSLFNCI